MTVGVEMSALTARAVGLVALARASDQVVLAQYSDKTMAPAELRGYEAAIAQLLQKAGRLPAYPGWRDHLAVGDKLDDHTGHVYVLADKRALCMVVVAIRGDGYPERVAQGLLQELAQRVQAMESEESLIEAKAGQLSGSLKPAMKELMRSYSDPAKLDKVTAVHKKVDEVKGLMHENVKKILETHVSLEELHVKSTSMSASADQFLKQSTTLKRQLQLRNLRVKATVALCSSALLAYILMPFFD